MVCLIKKQHKEVLLFLEQSLKKCKYFLQKNVHLVISGRTAARCAPFRYLEIDVPKIVSVGRTFVTSCMDAHTVSTNFLDLFHKTKNAL